MVAKTDKAEEFSWVAKKGLRYFFGFAKRK